MGYNSAHHKKSTTQNDYNNYLREKAFETTRDGEEGYAVVMKMQNYKSDLSYDEFKKGKRL